MRALESNVSSTHQLQMLHCPLSTLKAAWSWALEQMEPFPEAGAHSLLCQQALQYYVGTSPGLRGNRPAVLHPPSLHPWLGTEGPRMRDKLLRSGYGIDTGHGVQIPKSGLKSQSSGFQTMATDKPVVLPGTWCHVPTQFSFGVKCIMPQHSGREYVHQTCSCPLSGI